MHHCLNGLVGWIGWMGPGFGLDLNLLLVIEFGMLQSCGGG